MNIEEKINLSLDDLIKKGGRGGGRSSKQGNRQNAQRQQQPRGGLSKGRWKGTCLVALCLVSNIAQHCL